MASKKRVSHDDRVKMVVLRDEGYSLQEIASKLKCNRNTVCRTLAKQRACGTVDDRKRSGRPRISTHRDDRVLQRICLHNRRFTSSHLKREWEQSSGVTSSARTVRRRLDDVGLFGRMDRKKPLLTDLHRQLRLQWAKERKNWGVDQWYKVIWSNESKFNLFGSNGRVYIRRRVREDYLPECVQSTVKFGGGSVMVWGCVTSDGVGPLTTVDGRMKAKDYIDLLEQTLVSFMTTMGSDYVFQHCYVNISLYNEKLEFFVSVALLLAGTVYTRKMDPITWRASPLLVFLFTLGLKK